MQTFCCKLICLCNYKKPVEALSLTFINDKHEIASYLVKFNGLKKKVRKKNTTKEVVYIMFLMKLVFYTCFTNRNKQTNRNKSQLTLTKLKIKETHSIKSNIVGAQTCGINQTHVAPDTKNERKLSPVCGSFRQSICKAHNARFTSETHTC